jgi:penicillin-binding protein 1B
LLDESGIGVAPPKRSHPATTTLVPPLTQTSTSACQRRSDLVPTAKDENKDNEGTDEEDYDGEGEDEDDTDDEEDTTEEEDEEEESAEEEDTAE